MDLLNSTPKVKTGKYELELYSRDLISHLVLDVRSSVRRPSLSRDDLNEILNWEIRNPLRYALEIQQSCVKSLLNEDIDSGKP